MYIYIYISFISLMPSIQKNPLQRAGIYDNMHMLHVQHVLVISCNWGLVWELFASRSSFEKYAYRSPP